MMGGSGRGYMPPRMGGGRGRGRGGGRGGGGHGMMGMEHHNAMPAAGPYYGGEPRGGPMMRGSPRGVRPMLPPRDYGQGAMGEYDPMYDARARNPPPPHRPPPQIPADEPHNDCEILVMGPEELGLYAEILEKNVRGIGLSVDLMYPNSDLNTTEFLQALGNRGTKFAIEVTPDHEEHRSATVYVLKVQGKPIAHKNCPLDRVYNILRTEKGKMKREGLSLVPEVVRTALESVLDDKLITDKDYQSCIRFLVDRWQKQKEYEGNPDFEPGTGILSENQLKRKISQILGGDDDIVEPESNPTVQEAIQNIITSSSVLNVLKGQQPSSSTAPLIQPPPMASNPPYF